MAAHQRRYESWKERGGEKWERPAGGGLLPPPPAGKTKRKQKAEAPKSVQKQIAHPWSYIVLWYEECREFNPAPMGHQRLCFRSVEAYKDLFGIDIEPWEIDTMMKLDRVWVRSLPKKRPKADE